MYPGLEGVSTLANRKPTGALVRVAVLLPAMACLSLCADMHESIRVIAREYVASNSLAIKRPVYEIDLEHKTLWFSLGGVNPDVLGVDSDPLSAIFEKQIHLEALKTTLDTFLTGKPDWTKTIADADAALAAAISDVQQVGHAKPEHAEAFDQNLTQLETLIRANAASQGLIVKRGGRSPAADTFLVSCSTDPKGGRIKVIRYLQYRQCALVGHCDDSAWRELVSTEENLLGEYFYHVDWPQGLKAEGKIDVRNPSPLIFRPAK